MRSSLDHSAWVHIIWPKTFSKQCPIYSLIRERKVDKLTWMRKQMPDESGREDPKDKWRCWHWLWQASCIKVCFLHISDQKNQLWSNLMKTSRRLLSLLWSHFPPLATVCGGRAPAGQVGLFIYSQQRRRIHMWDGSGVLNSNHLLCTAANVCKHEGSPAMESHSVLLISWTNCLPPFFIMHFEKKSDCREESQLFQSIRSS